MYAFDKSWNPLRDQIFANQKRLGVIPQGCQAHPLGRKTCSRTGQLV